MIPKTIYQTWKTQNLPDKLEKLHSSMRKKNPEYKHIIYTDEQMDDYMHANAEKEIYKIYLKLNHIVAKADIWRYTILLNNGGIYLDIDSEITGSLENLISPSDRAIITAEKNKNLFVQWALLFEKNHIILENTLNNIIRDIHNNKNQFNHHEISIQLQGSPVLDFSAVIPQALDPNHRIDPSQRPPDIGSKLETDLLLNVFKSS